MYHEDCPAPRRQVADDTPLPLERPASVEQMRGPVVQGQRYAPLPGGVRPGALIAPSAPTVSRVNADGSFRLAPSVAGPFTTSDGRFFPNGDDAMRQERWLQEREAREAERRAVHAARMEAIEKMEAEVAVWNAWVREYHARSGYAQSSVPSAVPA